MVDLYKFMVLPLHARQDEAPIQGLFLGKQYLGILYYGLSSIIWFYQRNLDVETMWCVTCSAL